MHQYPNIVTANTRKIKKAILASGGDRLVARRVSESYRGVFVVMTGGEQCIVVQHAPNTENHHRTRNLPHPFTRRIKNNAEFA